jgi:hypothetical protein
MNNLLYPSLYQVNTRVWLTELSETLGHPATLDDIPDNELDNLEKLGFDWIWFLSVWQTGSEGQRVSRQNPVWRKEFEETLPDLKEEDIAGSGFAITRYHVHENLGGDVALVRLRKRLAKRGMKLMLDFVPNHTGLDHHWVKEHPEYYISGSEEDLEREPANYVRIGSSILAHGRDPFFPGWPDTLQLNYGNPALQEAMSGELERIGRQCDGVRCDMAMLVLPDVFHSTWDLSCNLFWPGAIQKVHEANPEFCFMAEVYWDLEWALQQQGFDYTYDKRLYDRLKEGHALPVREHFYASLKFQNKLARFLENHDEPRAAAEFPPGKYEAAALLTFFSPGLRFFHQGQFQGRKKRISPHLVRAPKEPVSHDLETFFSKLTILLQQPVFRDGDWQLLECLSAWEGNHSNGNYIAFAWRRKEDDIMLIIVNYSPDRSQCYVKLPFPGLENGQLILQDQIGKTSFVREGSELQARGLYLDEPGWTHYVFSCNYNM